MLMRTDPFREFDRLTDAVLGSGFGGGLGSAVRPVAMPMDAYREDSSFVVQLEIPGVDPSSIDLTVERNVLTVHAERKPAYGDAERVVGERRYGVFSRQMFLGETLDADRLSAQYDAGVLTLRIPVAEQAKPRRIEVTSSDQAQAISS